MASLKEKVAAEKENIAQALNEIELAMARTQRSTIELAAIGTFLHNIYSGFENILKQIFRTKELPIPHTPTSHKDLINSAVHGKIISQSLADDIFPFLTFRHFFVHAYGFMLEEDPVIKLATKIPNVHSQFMAEIDVVLQDFKKSEQKKQI